jgi:hypothetical protein
LDADRFTYREFAQRYAGMTFDGSERSPLWDKPVPKREIDLAAEGRRLGFTLIEGGREDEVAPCWRTTPHAPHSWERILVHPTDVRCPGVA